jgi:hypothetical protein
METAAKTEPAPDDFYRFWGDLECAMRQGVREDVARQLFATGIAAPEAALSLKKQGGRA